MTDQTSTAPAAQNPTGDGPRFFGWHPQFQGRAVQSVRQELVDDLRRDQRAYELALQVAEHNESASLQSILKLDNRWSPFDLGWSEADPVQLADYVLAVEVERERQQRMASPKELGSEFVAPAIRHAGPAAHDDSVGGGAGFPISKRWQVIVSVLVVIGLIALLIVQVF